MQPRDWRTLRLDEMNPNTNENQWAIWNILRAEENLKSIYFGCVERSIKALFLLNSGGTITILAYIYHAQNSCAKALLSIGLILFLLGLLFAVSVVGFDYFLFLKKLRQYNRDIRTFFAFQLPFNRIQEFSPNQNDKAGLIGVWLGIISLVFALLGIAFGLLGYFLN